MIESGGRRLCSSPVVRNTSKSSKREQGVAVRGREGGGEVWVISKCVHQRITGDRTPSPVSLFTPPPTRHAFCRDHPYFLSTALPIHPLSPSRRFYNQHFGITYLCVFLSFCFSSGYSNANLLFIFRIHGKSKIIFEKTGVLVRKKNLLN